MSCSTALKDKGYKLTPQRRMVIDILHQSHDHVTAEDIYRYMESRVSGVNKSTVYRTLELLEELGVVVRSELGGRFIYHHAEEGHHHHLVCRRCGSIIDCDEDMLSPLKETLLEKQDFEADLKHLVVVGLCSKC